MQTFKRRRHFSSLTMLRGKFGFTQQQFADTLGVSRSLIAMLETGNRSLPAHARDTYHELISKANEIPFSESMLIKRGRKPLHAAKLQFQSSTVTNFRTTRVSWKKKLALARMPVDLKSPDHALQLRQNCNQLKTIAEYRELLERMTTHRNDAAYYLEGAKIQLNASIKLGKEVEARLTGATVMLEAGNSIMQRLPEGEIRDKQEIANAKNHWLQLKLRHRFKKYSPMAILQMQLRINRLERELEWAEECVGLVARKKALLELEDTHKYAAASAVFY